MNSRVQNDSIYCDSNDINRYITIHWTKRDWTERGKELIKRKVLGYVLSRRVVPVSVKLLQV